MYNMKLLTLAEEVINELQGISFDARIWNPVVKSQIRLGNSYLKSKKPVPEFKIYGKDYPKEYKVFPIDEMSIKIDEKYNDGGIYDEDISGYDNNKIYRVYFTFGPLAMDSTINHELRHAYEDYMKLFKGRPATKESKECSTLFGKEFERFMTMGKSTANYFHAFYHLIVGLYYTSKIETSGFAETIYDEPSIGVISTIKSLIRYSNAEEIKKSLKPEELLKRWIQLKENYKIPILQRFKNYEDFIKWACDEINYKGNKTLKKLLKVKYLSQQRKKEGSK
jgi:hypothetical protein